jgi:hypothetical protein
MLRPRLLQVLFDDLLQALSWTCPVLLAPMQTHVASLSQRGRNYSTRRFNPAHRCKECGKIAIMTFFRTRSRFRAWAAAVAAYGLVLQMLFAGIVATQASAAAAPDDLFIICTGSGEPSAGDHGRTGAPGHHHDCGMCVLAAATAATMPTIEAVVVRNETVTVLSWILSARSRAGKLHSPKSAQGPPVAA